MENIGRRKYCSIDCRQELRYALDIRTGLLKALNIRYATFYFTDMMILMDVLPYGSNDIFSFIYPRSNGRKPAEDYRMMSAILGNEWWAEKNRTNKHYLASRHTLNQAIRNEPKANCTVPFETKIPVVRESSLIYLKLSKSELNSPELEKIIKSAYRIQAKKHHPDIGGETDTFRKIHQAYLDLVQWAENPSYMRRRGFPDKWFYDDNKNKWIQPTPYRKI
ncbi:MAG: J domain-containing protein [Deltaproteobacteria bacterium]|nr:J domain-containing protein [Deltaproteobacteria bacterium]